MSNTTEQIEPYYQKQAKEYVDHLFNLDVFNSQMTRDDMQAVEDLLAYLLDSNVKSAVKMSKLSLKFKKPILEKLEQSTQ